MTLIILMCALFVSAFQVTTIADTTVAFYDAARVNGELYLPTKDNSIIRTDGTLEGTTKYDKLETQPNSIVPLWENAIAAVYSQYFEVVDSTTERIQVFGAQNGDPTIERAFYMADQGVRKLLFTSSVKVYSHVVQVLDLDTRITTTLSNITTDIPTISTGGKYAVFTTGYSVYLYTTATGTLTEIHHQSGIIQSICLHVIGNKIYFHQRSTSQVTMRGMHEYNIETATWRPLSIELSEIHMANTHMIHTPSMENPHQMLFVDAFFARFCDFSKQNVTCGPTISINSVYGNTWSKERNEFYYYSFEDGSMIKVSAVTNKATTLQRNLKAPKPIGKGSLLFNNVQYNLLDDAIYYTTFEIGGRNDVYQCHLARMNVTSGEDEIVYEMCLDKDGHCQNFGQAMYVMNDGTIVAVKGTDEKNKLVRFIPTNLPTPKPRPADPNLTWLIVMGGILASVVVLGVLVTVGIVARSAIIKNRTYVSV